MSLCRSVSALSERAITRSLPGVIVSCKLSSLPSLGASSKGSFFGSVLPRLALLLEDLFANLRFEWIRTCVCGEQGAVSVRQRSSRRSGLGGRSGRIRASSAGSGEARCAECSRSTGGPIGVACALPALAVMRSGAASVMWRALFGFSWRSVLRGLALVVCVLWSRGLCALSGVACVLES